MKNKFMLFLRLCHSSLLKYSHFSEIPKSQSMEPFFINKKEIQYPIVAENKEHLKRLIQEEIKLHGDECNLNHIDVSRINNMFGLFSNSQFNGDISKWDVCNVKNMANMFFRSHFNGDISQWNVSKVEDMSAMFFSSKFNGNISNWDISKVRNMTDIFNGSNFKNDVTNWKPYSTKNTENAFYNCSAIIPYWFTYGDDINSRNTEINRYWLNKELNLELKSNTESKNKKFKL